MLSSVAINFISCYTTTKGRTDIVTYWAVSDCVWTAKYFHFCKSKRDTSESLYFAGIGIQSKPPFFFKYFHFSKSKRDLDVKSGADYSLSDPWWDIWGTSAWEISTQTCKSNKPPQVSLTSASIKFFWSFLFGVHTFSDFHSDSVSEPSQSVDMILWWPTWWLTCRHSKSVKISTSALFAQKK